MDPRRAYLFGRALKIRGGEGGGDRRGEVACRGNIDDCDDFGACLERSNRRTGALMVQLSGAGRAAVKVSSSQGG